MRESAVGRMLTGVKIDYGTSRKEPLIGVVGHRDGNVVRVHVERDGVSAVTELCVARIVRLVPRDGMPVPLPPIDPARFKKGKRTLVPGVR